MSRADLPGRFRYRPKTQTSRSRRAFKPSGPGARLMAQLGEYAYVSRLRVADLDAAISDDPIGLYDQQTVDALYKAAARSFSGPFYLVLEAGRGDVITPDAGRLHAHVIHHRNDGPSRLSRDTLRCHWVYDGPGLYRYLHKADPDNLEAVLAYTATKVLAPNGKSPRTHRHFLGPKRTAWLHSTVLYDLTLLDPLPPLLACGRCRRHHLRGCSEYTAAAAAFSRNEPQTDLAGNLDAWTFTPDLERAPAAANRFETLSPEARKKLRRALYQINMRENDRARHPSGFIERSYYWVTKKVFFTTS